MVRFWLTISLLLFVPLTALSKPISDRFFVGKWAGNAYANSEGRFTHCSITAIYESGTTLGFSISSDYELLIGLGKKGWELTTGLEYTVALDVDGRSLGSYSATPVMQKSIWFNLGN